MVLLAEDKIEKNMAIVGLVLNVIILPGLGTLIGGGSKYRTQGIWQLIVAIVSIPLMLLVIGFFSWAAMWIWALITGIKMIQESS